MADIVDTYRVDGDSKDAQAAVKQLEGVAKRSYKQMDKALGKYGGRQKKTFADIKKAADNTKKAMKEIGLDRAYSAAAQAAGLLVREIGKGFQAYRERIRTTDQLTAALKNQGLEANQNVLALGAMAGQLEMMTGISDESIRSMQQLAINMGVSLDQVDDFTRASIRLSSVTGQDATEAMKQLVKSLSGLSGELGEANPKIKALTAEELKAGQAVRLLNEDLKNSLELTDNLDGNVTKLGAAWDSLMEEVGGTSDIETVNEALKDLTDTFRDLETIVGSKGLKEGLLALTQSFSETAILSTAAIAGTAGVAGLATAIGNIRRGFSGMTVEEEAEALRGEAPGLITGGLQRVGLTGASEEFQKRMATAAKKDEEARKARRRKGKAQQAEYSDLAGTAGIGIAAGEGGADLGVMTIGGLPVDVATNTVLPPAPPDPGEIASVVEQMAAERAEAEAAASLVRMEKETVLAEHFAEREQWKTDLLAHHEALRLEEEMRNQEIREREQAASQERIEAAMSKGTNTLLGIGKDFTGTMIDGFMAMAEGGDVAFEVIMKDFLRATGTKLISAGVADVFEGGARLIRSYGVDQSGTVLAAMGAAEIAGGAAMIGGSTAIQPPGSGGGGGGAAGPTGAGGAGGAGGAATDTDRSGMLTGATTVNVTVVGKVGPEEVRTIQRSIIDANERGF